MGAMVDLSHPLSGSMPVYPGTPPPTFERAWTVDRDGFAERLLVMASHTGTHVDAPAHMIAGGATLDDIPLERFAGPARVLDVSAFAGGSIPLEAVREAQEGRRGTRFLLLRTGWSRRWGSRAYFEGFPVLTAEAAGWLARRPLWGVGVDAPSVDPVGSSDFAVHRLLLGSGKILVENLRGLEGLPEGRFTFSCLPLAIAGGDGSPVRAAAWF